MRRPDPIPIFAHLRRARRWGIGPDPDVDPDAEAQQTDDVED